MSSADQGPGGVTSRRLPSSLAVFLFTAIFTAPLVRLGLQLYDEGVRVYGAERVLAGETPYHDFFAYYGPGEFYWPALLFKLFGTQIVVARLGTVFFISIAAAAVFALARSAGLSWPWAALPVVALVLPLRSGDQLPTCDPALALVLAAGAVLSEGTGRLARYLSAGVLLGFAAVFRHDFALYGTAGAVVTSLWRYRQTLRRSGDSPSSLRRVLAGVWRPGVVVAGIAVVIIPVYGLLALRGPRVLVAMLLANPPKMMAFRTLPYGYYELRSLYSAMAGGHGLAWTLAAGPTLVVLLTPLLAVSLCVSLCARGVRRRVMERDGAIAPLLFVLGSAGGLAVYALGRSDWYHVYPLHVLSVLACVIIAAPRASGSTRLAIGLAVVAVIAVVLRIVVAAPSEFREMVPLHLARAKGVAVSRNAAWIQDAARDVWRYGGGGPILVASERHDRVLANAVVLYFLAGRPSGTYFHDFVPGVTTTLEVQERIVADLTKNRVRTVVIVKTPLPDEPNRSRVSSGVFVLDEYLRSKFSPVRETEEYRVLIGRE